MRHLILTLTLAVLLPASAGARPATTGESRRLVAAADRSGIFSEARYEDHLSHCYVATTRTPGYEPNHYAVCQWSYTEYGYGESDHEGRAFRSRLFFVEWKPAVYDGLVEGSGCVNDGLQEWKVRKQLNLHPCPKEPDTSQFERGLEAREAEARKACLKDAPAEVERRDVEAECTQDPSEAPWVPEQLTS